MNKAEFLEMRETLLNEAQTFIDSGDVENARAKRIEIEELDARFEQEAIEMANAAVLKEPVADEIATELIDETEVPTVENIIRTEANYHDSFYKRLMGKPMTDEEVALFNMNTTEGAAAIPTETEGEIIRKLKQYAPMLNEVTLLTVGGYVKFAVEKSVDAATVHEEGATITAATDELVEVVLNGYEITKLIRVSKSMSKMSVAGFESWLVENLTESIAAKISANIADAIAYNFSIGEGSTFESDPTEKTLNEFIATLDGGYDKFAKFLMNKKTFYTYIASIENKSKNAVVVNDGGRKTIQGYEVIIDSSIPDSCIYLGDFTKVVANLAEDITVESDFDLNTNSYRYLGCAIFDCKVAVKEAIVRLIRA